MILMTEIDIDKFKESKAIRSMIANSYDSRLDYGFFLDFLTPAIVEIFGFPAENVDFNTYVHYKNSIRENLNEHFGITLLK